MSECPCGLGKEYAECCEPLICGGSPAETAEALMRARYSAYVKQETEYIFHTTHPSRRQPDSRQVIEEWALATTWRDLKIISTEGGGPEDDTGIVEFIADFTEKGKDGKHHERAEFRRENGVWMFYDGKPPPVETVRRKAPKIGRNDPCPCGSRKKYKKCCLG